MTALRRTLRRCTAVVVAALGLNVTAVTETGNLWGSALFVGAVCYLVASAFAQVVLDAGPDVGTGTDGTVQGDPGT